METMETMMKTMAMKTTPLMTGNDGGDDDDGK